uniref:Uncharacterized protein n=1 Tax=Anguilla anguilla TaxID=7936 RepID=A0A0E9VWX7_ANGAN
MRLQVRPALRPASTETLCSCGGAEDGIDGHRDNKCIGKATQ